MEKKVRVSPSIIAIDYNDEEKLSVALGQLKAAKVSLLHLDVMDGKFVPEKTFGPEFVQKMRNNTDFLLDTHLMVASPEKVVDKYISAGADIITFHYEAASDIENLLNKIKANGLLAGVSIKPQTDVSVLAPFIKAGLIDLVLVMSVEPGACGRPFDESSIEKIKRLRQMSSKIDIAIDGGINVGNIARVVDAGANIVVAGSGIFKTEDPVAAIKALRQYKRN